MRLTLGGQEVHFTQFGRGNDVLLLHGWGSTGENLLPVARHLASHMRVTVPDLPGFGLTPPPPEAWGTSEYAGFLRNFLNELMIHRTHIIAHSFGGRLAIHFAATWPECVDRIVLVNSAGIRRRRTAKYYFKIGAFKTLRKFFGSSLWGSNGTYLVEYFSSRLGSRDYREAPSNMRPTLVRIVNEDMRHLLSSITAPTLLVWGSDDTATPVSDGHLMEKLIPEARLVVFPGAGHFSYLDRLPQFLRTLDSFLGVATVAQAGMAR